MPAKDLFVIHLLGACREEVVRAIPMNYFFLNSAQRLFWPAAIYPRASALSFLRFLRGASVGSALTSVEAGSAGLLSWCPAAARSTCSSAENLRAPSRSSVRGSNP